MSFASPQVYFADVSKRILVRPHQLPKPTWWCRWFHGFPARPDATFVYDVEKPTNLIPKVYAMAGMLCWCGAFKYPTPEYGG